MSFDIAELSSIVFFLYLPTTLCSTQLEGIIILKCYPLDLCLVPLLELATRLLKGALDKKKYYWFNVNELFTVMWNKMSASLSPVATLISTIEMSCIKI